MNRRTFLSQLRNFCVLYGIQGILSEHSFAATPRNRLVNFVIKYTGGGTDENGIGQWTASNVLSPLSPYIGDMTFPLGLDAQFNAPMNSHASPQICALSGSMTGFVMRETHYPTGDLKNYSTGNGKSIDVLIGEKLQKEYKSKIPYLLIGNNDLGYLASTHRTSSWGDGGKLIHAHTSIGSLRSEVSNRITCEKFTKEVYLTRLKALEHIRQNNAIFSSNYLIDKDKFAVMKENLEKNINRYELNVENIDAGRAVSCTALTGVEDIAGSASDQTAFNQKMNQMYDLSIIALKQNITRVLTVNLYMHATHATSHFIGGNPIEDYYDASRFLQASIAQFIGKLKAAGLYDETMIFCNAGSCTKLNVHNYENLSTYVINSGGKKGINGAANVKKPVGSLLLDILNRFGINYTEYGGTDHIYGVGKPGGYI